MGTITIAKSTLSMVLFGAFVLCAQKADAGLILEQTTKKGTGDKVQLLPAAHNSVNSSNLFPKRRSLDMESYVTERISQSGERPFSMPVLRGAGKNVVLRESLAQILPAGWKVFTDGPVDINRKFNWAGEKTWIMILHSILEINSLHGYVDWTNKEITLFSNQTKIANLGAAAQHSAVGISESDIARIAAAVRRADSNDGRNVKLAQDENDIQVHIGSGASPKAMAPQSWTMTADKTVKENLEDWVSKVPGWKLVWSARTGEHIYDYPSKPFVGYSFKGDLLGTTGVISRVVASFAESNPPLAVEFFLENKVIEITVYKTSTEQMNAADLRDKVSSSLNRK